MIALGILGGLFYAWLATESVRFIGGQISGDLPPATSRAVRRDRRHNRADITPALRRRR